MIVGVRPITLQYFCKVFLIVNVPALVEKAIALVMAMVRLPVPTVVVFALVLEPLVFDNASHK